jgi:mono/diheme cytochrome c family protein
VSCPAQNVANVVKQGEAVFSKTCATGYCHGIRGGPSGAPRLAARGFDQAYISKVVTQGVPDTGMASFSTRLSPPDLEAVIAYVATLNGIANPDVSMDDAGNAVSTRPTLIGEAARGARLFAEAVRGFGRCSTCHEVGSFGIPVAAPLAKVPASAAELKALATPDVKTGTMGGETMPVLVLSQGKQPASYGGGRLARNDCHQSRASGFGHSSTSAPRTADRSWASISAASPSHWLRCSGPRS